MPFTGPAEDRLAIRELIEIYGDAVMTGDAEAWSTVWADDAYWSLPEFEGHEEFIGKDAIVKGWIWSMSLFAESKTEGAPPTMIYIATPGSIEVTGDRATARVYTSEIYTAPGAEKETRVRGRYDDELAKIGGKWLFTKRVYKMLHSS